MNELNDALRNAATVEVGSNPFDIGPAPSDLHNVKIFSGHL